MNEFLVGTKFGYWTIVNSNQFRDKYKHLARVCKCECGTIRLQTESILRKGKTSHCGCKWIEQGIANGRYHGDAGNPKKNIKPYYLYNLWSGIFQRTTNTKDHAWDSYGERGIKMYKGWQRNYEAFKQWMLENIGERPHIDMSLDRINNNGNYEPGNLKWSTQKQQCNNRRNNI